VVAWKRVFAEQRAGGSIQNDNISFGVTGHNGGANVFQNRCYKVQTIPMVLS
jgi:hypothetical protein